MYDTSDTEYIREHLGKAACYEAIAEEAAEVAKAALKCSRILRGENPTPKTIYEAEADLGEELGDLKLACHIADVLPDTERMAEKERRMAQRISGMGTYFPTSYEEVHIDQLDDQGRRLYESAQRGIFEPSQGTAVRDIFPNEEAKHQAERHWKEYEDYKQRRLEDEWRSRASKA